MINVIYMDIAIDLGKKRSYVVMEDNGRQVKEGYTDTTREGFDSFFGRVNDPHLIVEATSTVNRIANIFEGYDITVANPSRVRLIAESVKKTDKIDAHVLMDLYKKDYLPRSYLPSKETRDGRDLCRDRALLIRERTMIKNKIRYHAYCLGIEFKDFTKKALKILKMQPKLSLLVEQLESMDKIVKQYDEKIAIAVQDNNYAKLIDTIPGIGNYGALVIASEIGDINRFPTEFHLFSYAGLVPRIYQSGEKEWKGRIAKGDVFLKTILIECVQIHVRRCNYSQITSAYNRLRIRIGNKKARVAAARRLLRVIYWMLKRNDTYHI